MQFRHHSGNGSKWTAFSLTAKKLFSFGVCLALLASAGVASAGQAKRQSGTLPPLIVERDMGGFMMARSRQVDDLRATKRPVRIVGDRCFSACTFYLGLEDVCISRKTRFGFHGAMIFGLVPAQGDLKEVALNVISAHYPEPVRTWFLEKGHKTVYGYKVLKGEELIRHGIKECK